MMWFVIGMLVVLAGGAATLYLVLHVTADADEEDNAPFSPDGDSPLGSTSEHAGDQSGSEEGGDSQHPPDAPGAPSADVMPVGRYQDHSRESDT